MSVNLGSAKPETESVGSRPSRLGPLWMSTVGKKALMALSGMVLFGYVVAHLLGNLQIYLGGKESPSGWVWKIDQYARFLHDSPVILWTARIILLTAVLVHAIAGIQLWLRSHEARPIGYRARENIQASTPSRTMIWTGLAIAAFVIYHVLDLTVGVAHAGPYLETKPFENLATGFSSSHPVPALLYIAAMIALGMHLWHGVYSMFGSLGLDNARYMNSVRRVAALLATVIALANISVPVAVLTGLLHG